MQKKFIIAGMTVMIIAMLIGGATFAWFTDSATNSGNTFATGTVDIMCYRDNGDVAPGPMFYTTVANGEAGDYGTVDPLNATGEWAPGDAHTRYLNVENTGSLDARIIGIRASISGDTDFLNNPDAMREFQDNMMITVKYHDTQLMDNVPLSDLILTGNQFHSVASELLLVVGGVRDLAFTCTLSAAAGDDLQGCSPLVDFEVLVEQVTNNP